MTAAETAAAAKLSPSDREKVWRWMEERDRNIRLRCLRVACRWQRMINEKFAECGLHPYED